MAEDTITNIARVGEGNKPRDSYRESPGEGFRARASAETRVATVFIS
jgi:hypothetical protein